MSKTLQELKQAALDIKRSTAPESITAPQLGQLLDDIIEYAYTADESAINELKGIVEGLVEKTGRNVVVFVAETNEGSGLSYGLGGGNEALRVMGSGGIRTFTGVTGNVPALIIDGSLIQTGASPEQISTAIKKWLDEHPEATTTVADGSITLVKLSTDLQNAIKEGGTAIDSMSGGFILSEVAAGLKLAFGLDLNKEDGTVITDWRDDIIIPFATHLKGGAMSSRHVIDLENAQQDIEEVLKPGLQSAVQSAQNAARKAEEVSLLVENIDTDAIEANANKAEQAKVSAQKALTDLISALQEAAEGGDDASLAAIQALLKAMPTITNGNADFEISDEDGYIILQVLEGYPVTLNFNGQEVAEKIKEMITSSDIDSEVVDDDEYDLSFGDREVPVLGVKAGHLYFPKGSTEELYKHLYANRNIFLERLKGRTIVILGDSQAVAYRWAKLFSANADEYGYKVYNKAVGSAGWLANRGIGSIKVIYEQWDEVKSLITDEEPIIIVSCGSNGKENLQQTESEILSRCFADTSGKSNEIDCAIQTLKDILRDKPKCYLHLIRNWSANTTSNQTEFNIRRNALLTNRTLCEYFNANFIDLWQEGQIHSYTEALEVGGEYPYRRFTNDGVHPTTEEGYRRFFSIILNRIANILTY